jgi:hypothetical protein
MIPIGYMAKRICKPPEALKLPAHVLDIFSVSNCVNDDFDNHYVDHWKHNGYWFFHSPALIHAVATENSIDLSGTMPFYYEAFEREFHNHAWRPFGPDCNIPVNVLPPTQKHLEGYDVVTFWVENSPAPEHSPLSCNGLAKEIETNQHCLIDSLEQAHQSVQNGEFRGGEPGTLRIIAVYSVDWPFEHLKANME